MNFSKFIPSLFTIANLLCGFLTILVADFRIGAILLLVSIFCDAMDGIVARALNAQSALGKELDSLADLVSFGVAPAYLYFLLAPGDEWYFYACPMFLVIGSALRLAKFNLLPSNPYFNGLPTPATAFFMIGVFISYNANSELTLQILGNPFSYFLIPIFFMLMMLSNMKMFSLKGLDRQITKNKYQLAVLLFFISVLILDAKLAIPLTVFAYILLSFLQNFAHTD